MTHSTASSTIVVTGMGLVCPLGCGVPQAFGRLVVGQSGITSIAGQMPADFPVRIAGMVPDITQDTQAGFDAQAFADAKERRKMDRFTLYALAAAHEALTQAGWHPQSVDDCNATATVIGTGIGGFTTITEAKETLDQRGHRRLSPFVVPAFLANLAAGNVSIRHQFRGPIGCPVTACAAGLQAIGDGMRLIRSGEARVAVVGGADSCVDPLSLGAFHAMKALSTRNEVPQQASRPFDRERNGFVMGEGAGLLVIETLDHALARGARPLAQISGYGTSADAWHLVAGPDTGEGCARAMRSALDMARLDTSAIGHINAHATSTPVGDRAEVAGLRAVFGDALGNIPVAATKSATGHLLGAAGGVESIFTVMALRDGLLPPTLNLQHPDEDCADLDLLPLTARPARVDHALCNGFGFGGVNASVVFSRYG